MKFSEIREKYPQYDHLSDQELGKALHKKYYSQLDYDDFSKKVGLSEQVEKPKDKSRTPFIDLQTKYPFLMGYSDPAAGYAQLASKVAPDSRTPEMVLSGIPSTEDRISKAIINRENQYGDRGFDVGRMAGFLASPGTLLAYRVPNIKGIPKTATWAAEGGIVGAGAPVVSDNFAESKAAQIGVGAAVSPVVGHTLPGASRVAQSLWKKIPTPKNIAEKYIKREFGKDLPKYKEAISSYEKRIPGYSPTVEQALGQQQRKMMESGTPDLYSKDAIQLSKDLRTAGTKIAESDIKSDLAIKKAVAGNKLTKSEEKARLKFIQKEADKKYSKAKETIEMPEELRSRPIVSSAIKKVEQAVKNAPERYGAWPEEGQPFTVAQFARIKRQVRTDAANKLAKKKIGKEESSEAMQAFNALDETLKSKSKVYKETDEWYAEQMKPITQGKTERALEQKLFPDARQKQPAAYIKAIDDESLLTKLAGVKTESIEQIFEDASQKRAVKEMLLDDWATKSQYMKGKSNITNVGGEITFQLPHILSTPVVITNAVLKRFGQDLTPKVYAQLELLMTNPNKFIEIIDGPASSQATQEAVGLIRKIGAFAAAQNAGEQ